MIKLLHYFENKSRFAFILVFVFFQTSENLFAQHVSNKGTDFWVAFPQQSDDINKKMVLYLIAEENTTGTVSVGNTSSQVSIKANEVTVVPVPNEAYLIEEEQKILKAIHVVAAKPITVTAHIFIGNGRARSSATLVLPTPSLGKEYFTFSLRPQANEADSFSEFVIVAPEDGTTITIQPAAATTSGKSLPFTLTLAAGEAYLVKSNSDLTGSYITSCKNIAVFSGNTKIKSTCNNSISNPGNLYQQLYPVSTWGKSVVTTPSKSRPTDLIKVIASENNTTIRINGAPPVINGVSFTGKLAKGAPLELPVSTASHISSDKPIAIGQFNCGQNFSDPEMVLLSPTEQGVMQASFYSLLKDNNQAATTLSSHFVNITMKTADVAGAALQIDGQVPAASFTTIQGSAFSFSQIDLQPGNKPLKITAGVPFNAVAYGFGTQESYAFVAGTQLTNLGSSISTSSTIAGEPATCEGEAVTFTSTLPYQPNFIKWDFGDGTTETVSDMSSRLSPVHKYSKPGIFMVKLTTINSENTCNNPEVTSFNFKVNEKPKANYTFTQACYNQPTTFIDASTPPAGSTITSWSWDFDDAASGTNNTSTVQNPTHVFSAPGNYEVKVTITASNTCARTFSQTVTISPLPVPKFKAQPVCEGTKTIFKNESTIANGSIVKWEWDFGDGKTSGEENPEFLFTQTGTNIPVSLKVTSAAGCTDITTGEIVVYPKPKAEAGPDITILRNESTSLNGSGTGTFSWVPATGLSNTAISNPVATPVATTQYKLMVTSPEGCVATDSVTITVLDKLSIPNAFSPNDDGVNDTWVITGLKDYPLATVEIFDRWGNVVFSGGSKAAWDGKRDEKALPMATYYYIVSQNNGNKPVKGQISIIR